METIYAVVLRNIVTRRVNWLGGSLACLAVLLCLFWLARTTPAQSSQNRVALSGVAMENFAFTVPDNILFDATGWTSKAIGPGPQGNTNRAVAIYGSRKDQGTIDIVWRGGVIIGSIPPSWDWRTTHEFGGAGLLIHNAGPIELQHLRIHNVEDGIKIREAPEYSNTGSWMLRDCYFTAIRDDAIDNDRFEPGRVEDCLFDGVYVFISEQEEIVSDDPPIGPAEDDAIYIHRVYARLYGTNAGEGPGKWFKLLGDIPHHNLLISDSVFAIGSEPRLGWSDETIPPEVRWIGDNNFILWLGTPGTYAGPRPEGVTLLEGVAARKKWISVRNQWLSDHGLPAQDLPADYNPHYAPVMPIPMDP
jgi:hypothetical protein